MANPVFPIYNNKSFSLFCGYFPWGSGVNNLQEVWNYKWKETTQLFNSITKLSLKENTDDHQPIFANFLYIDFIYQTAYSSGGF